MRTLLTGKNQSTGRTHSLPVFFSTILCCAVLLLSGISTSVFAADDNDSEDTTPRKSVSVEYYTDINGSWQRIATEHQVDGTTEGGRYYVTASHLESIYGKFGFQAAKYNGEKVFPHTAGNDTDTLWGDVAPVGSGTDAKILLTMTNQDKIFVYYVPKTLGDSKSIARNDAELLKNNTFYSVTISDPGKIEAEHIGTSYVAAGSRYSITLTKTGSMEWYLTNLLTGEAVTPTSTTASNGSITYTFDSLTQPLKITTATAQEEKYTIHYQAATLSSCLQQLGGVSSGIQQVETDGTIKDKDEYTVSWDSTQPSHEILEPDEDKTLASVPQSSKKKKYYYSFAGWQIGETDILLKPGETLTPAQMRQAETNGVVELKAIWKGLSENGRIASANFYLNKYCEIADNMGDGAGTQNEANYTTSVYTTTVTDTQRDSVDPKVDSTLLLGNDATNAYDIDNEIRNMTTTAYNGVSIGSMPSDESVLAQLRATYDESKDPIMADGKIVQKDHLTTDHFKIRWYVVKYHHDDGWHVDGILVQKEAKLRITKTFSGDESAMTELASKGFNITVQHDPGQDPASDNDIQLTTDYTLSLQSAENASEGMTGYTSFDPATHTYTWLLDGRAGTEYCIQEHNYTLSSASTRDSSSSSGWNTIHRYRITNSSAATGSWKVYHDDKPISVIAESYPNDVNAKTYQTVSLENTYIKMGACTISKVDSVTNTGLSDISFTITPADPAAAKDFRLYRMGDSSRYTANSSSGGTLVSDNKVTTDANGKLYLMVPAGTYRLTEHFPSGYTGADSIEISVDSSGNVTTATPYDKNNHQLLNTDHSYFFGTGTSMLTIKNQSELLTAVTAQSDWGSTPEAEQKPVKVELWCNGVKVTDTAAYTFTQTLDDSNSWTYTWKNLPLFVNGQVAKYSLREVQIGDTYYDSGTNSDGFEDYAVVYDPARYREADTGAYQDEPTWVDQNNVRHYSRYALLQVHNLLDNGKTYVFVSKEWDDNNDQDGKRPDSITVKLLRNGEDTGKTVTLDAGNNWGGNFTDLKKYDNGTEIQYSVEESSVPDGYTSTLSGSAKEGYILTNSHTPEITSVTGINVWEDEDNKDGIRPQEVTLELLANGTKVDSKTVQPNENGDWAWSFTDLPKYNNSKKITYTVTEEDINGYKTTIEGNDTEGFTITNLHTSSVNPADPVDPGDGPADPGNDPENPGGSGNGDKPSVQPGSSADSGSAAGTTAAAKAAETGDSAHPAIYLLIAVLAAAGATGTVLLRKKKQIRS